LLPTGADREEQASVVHEVIGTGPFLGRSVVGCVPENALRYSIIRVPAEPSSDLDAEVHEQLARRLEMPADAFRSQHYEAGVVWEGEKRCREIVAMAAEVDALDAYLDMLVSCGLRPVAVETCPSALARAVTHPPCDGASTVILDLGHQFSTLTVRAEDTIRFIRRLDVGLGSLDEAVASLVQSSPDEAERLREDRGRVSEGGVPDVQAARLDAVEQGVDEHARLLAREIGKCLQYYSVTFREARPSSAIVVGGGAGEAALVGSIAGHAGLDLQAADVLGPPWARPALGQLPEPLGFWATALGLASYDEVTVRREAA
jgi:Tfp pilus assembly PilM family ATPase